MRQSGARLTFREPTPHDADVLLRLLRQCDRNEAAAAVGAERVEWALRHTLSSSLLVRVAECDGQLVAAFGVAAVSTLNGIGCPWMVGTDLLDTLPRAVMTQTRAYIPRMLALFPHLTNHVDARNTRSIRLLRWLGFAILPAAPYGVVGLPFHRFEMRG
jgi:hypothetical protein